MKKVISILLALICAFSVSVTSFAAAISAPDSLAAVEIAKSAFDTNAKTKFDVNNDGRITAADARATLLTSAGLSQQNLNTNKMDVDIDGSITALDARTILRISAGLEVVQDYMYSEMLSYFNAILNTAIPNRYSLYYNGMDTTVGVKSSDPKGVLKSLDDAFKNIDDTVSFSDSLAGGTGDEIYDAKNTIYGSNTDNSKKRMMKIGADEEVSSYLTISDVSKIEYKKNQSYTFKRYGTTKNAEGRTVVDRNTVVYTETVSGLDYMKVYIKADNDVNGTHVSKVSTVYKQSELEADVNKIAEQFNNMSMEMTQLYQIVFDVTPSVGGVKYYNAFVEIYFKPEDGTIVAANYSVDTDYTIGLYMDVKIFLIAPYVNVDKEGLVSITNSTRTTKEYYFYKNLNPNNNGWKKAIQ